MIYKYDFSVFGNTFYPEKILNKIEGDFIIDTYFSPKDKKFSNTSEEYGYGGISFWHPQKFATEAKIVDYEKAFVDFIEKNDKLFKENGVDDLQIFMEIYYNGSQCNFEIFNKDLLKKLTKYKVSFPVSVYLLGEKEIQEWENEIKSKWDNCQIIM